ncbi:MAG: ATP-binding protein [Ignavibacteriaceae bacterium]
MSITKKIGIAFLAVLMLLVIISSLFLFELTNTNHNIIKLEKETKKQRLASELQTSVNDLLMSSHDYIITSKATYMENYDSLKNIVNDKINKLNQFNLTPLERRQLQYALQDVYHINLISQKIFRLNNIRTNPEAISLMEEIDNPYGKNINKEVTVIYDTVKANVRSVKSTVSKSSSNILIIVITFSLLALLISILVVFLTMQNISKRILELVKIAEKITQKDFSVYLAPKGKDEIGLLIIAFNAMIEEIHRRYEELENFSSIVAHDLKSPLNGIIGFGEFLKEDYQDKLDDEANENIDVIISSGKRMALLINDLLEFARAGKTVIPEQAISLDNILADIKTDLDYVIKQKNVIIDIKQKLPICHCDKTQISQVWKNLITNSIKYNDSVSPTIEIGYEEVKDELPVYRFHIKDNGIGIDEKFINRIFMPFQRAVSGSKYEGTGIGLAIVKRVIENHKGRIWVDSKIGEGTTFYFTIPKQ